MRNNAFVDGVQVFDIKRVERKSHIVRKSGRKNREPGVIMKANWYL